MEECPKSVSEKSKLQNNIDSMIPFLFAFFCLKTYMLLNTHLEEIEYISDAVNNGYLWMWYHYSHPLCYKVLCVCLVFMSSTYYFDNKKNNFKKFLKVKLVRVLPRTNNERSL